MRSKEILIVSVFILTALGCATSKNIQSDIAKPEIGKEMVDFTLTNVHHYRSRIVSLKDFKGKWLVMDFWFSGCTFCIKSFPKLNSWQEKFKDHVQFLMIGSNGKKLNGSKIELLYENLRQRQNLNLAIAYDSILDRQWNIWAMPYIIIVDPEGIVRVITDGRDMNDEKIQDLIDQKPASFYPWGGYDQADGENVTGSTENVVYRSLLRRWNHEQQLNPSVNDYVEDEKKIEFKVAGAPLYWLYNLAYFGKESWTDQKDPLYNTIYPYPVLETQDSGLFKFDFLNKNGIYNYDLIIPRNRNVPGEIMRIMRSDLVNIFGFEVTVEERMLPVWILIAEASAVRRLANSGQPAYWNMLGDGVGGFELRNVPVSDLLKRIMRYISDNEPPFFDETGITGNIDITMDALMTDRNQIIIALRKNGLDLVKGRKRMKCLVIRSPDKKH